jgi:hypothetical protein
MKRALLCLLALGLLPTAAGRAAAGYTYTRIAGADEAFLFTGAPVISADGTVFFAGSQGGVGGAIFAGNGGGPATPVLTNASGLSEFNQLAVNGHGTVAFEAFRASDGRRGIFTYDGTALTPIATTGGPFASVAAPRINDAGTVTFRASFDPQGSRQAVYTGNGGPLTQVATSDPPRSSFSFAPLPAINASGLVAFNSSLSAGDWGIFTGTGGQLTQLYGSGGALLTLGTPDLNDAGQVVFLAGTQGGQAILVGDGGPLTTVADTSQTFQDFLSGPGPSINNQGEVVFLADLTASLGGGTGIFTGPDPVADKVIAVGDDLFGGRVVGLGLGRGLNDSGQITFIARVQQGSSISEYVVRADPLVAPVPAPPGLVLAGLGALSLLGYGWRRRRSAVA